MLTQQSQQRAFDQIKTTLTSAEVLACYDPSRPTIITAQEQYMLLSNLINDQMKQYDVCSKDFNETSLHHLIQKGLSDKTRLEVIVVFLTAANHNVRNAHAVLMKRSYSVVGFHLTG